MPVGPHVPGILAPLRAAAASRWTYLIEPPHRDYKCTPGDLAPVADFRRAAGPDWAPDFLPEVLVAVTLVASGGDEGEHFTSTLRVCFFQAEFAPPLDDAIAAALRALDWSAHAEYGPL